MKICVEALLISALLRETVKAYLTSRYLLHQGFKLLKKALWNKELQFNILSSVACLSLYPENNIPDLVTVMSCHQHISRSRNSSFIFPFWSE